MRKLTLRKEALVELTTEDMTKVVGAGTLKECIDTQVCITDPCITPPVSGLRCALSLGPDVCS